MVKTVGVKGEVVIAGGATDCARPALYNLPPVDPKPKRHREGLSSWADDRERNADGVGVQRRNGRADKCPRKGGRG